MIRKIGWIVITAATALSGCDSNFYAKSIVEQDTSFGRWGQDLAASNRQMVKSGQITAARRVEVADGTVIDVWVIEGTPLAENFNTRLGTVVILHGLGDSKQAYLPLGQRLAKMGYTAVLIDQRAHGRSTGEYTTFGAKESLDVKAVMDQLQSEGLISTTIYAYGYSLGGMTAIQWAALDYRCKGVMIMSAFKSMESFARAQLAVMAPGMSEEEFQKVLAEAGELAGFSPADASCVEAAKALTCPLLVAHGALDMNVPVRHAEQIYEAAPQPKQLVVVPWADHRTIRLAREQWLADQIDLMGRTGLRKEAVTPEAPTTPE